MSFNPVFNAIEVPACLVYCMDIQLRLRLRDRALVFLKSKVVPHWAWFMVGWV